MLLRFYRRELQVCLSESRGCVPGAGRLLHTSRCGGRMHPSTVPHAMSLEPYKHEFLNL